MRRRLAQPGTAAVQNSMSWVAIALVGLADIMWASALGVRLDWTALPFLALSGAIGFFFTRFWPNERLAALVLSTTAILGSLFVVGVLGYLCFISNPVAIDGTLSRIDRLIGFDWVASMKWLDGHPSIKSFLSFCYWSIVPQIVIAPLILTAINRVDRLLELTWLLVISLTICGVISIFFPAECAWSFYGFEPHQVDACRMPTLRLLRSGEIKQIVVGRTFGIITFPSFHAAMGLILIWAFRGMKYLFPLTASINFGMICATPNIGGHYLIDVIAGLTIVAFLIAAEMFLMNRRFRANPQNQKSILVSVNDFTNGQA
jgi:hypothetical protein